MKDKQVHREALFLEAYYAFLARWFLIENVRPSHSVWSVRTRFADPGFFCWRSDPVLFLEIRSRFGSTSPGSATLPCYSPIIYNSCIDFWIKRKRVKFIGSNLGRIRVYFSRVRSDGRIHLFSWTPPGYANLVQTTA